MQLACDAARMIREVVGLFVVSECGGGAERLRLGSSVGGGRDCVSVFRGGASFGVGWGGVVSLS